MSRIEPVRSCRGPPDRLDAHADRGLVREPAEQVQEAALARPVEPDHGGVPGLVEGLHVPRHVAARIRLDDAGRRHLGPPVGGTEAPLAERAGRHERAAARVADRRAHDALGEPVEEPSHRRAGIPAVAAVERGVDGPRGGQERRVVQGRGAGRRRRGRRGGRRRGGRTAVGPEDDDRPDLHEVAPRLGDAALGRPGYLAAPRLAAELPEQLGHLHEAGGRDRVADAEEAAARGARQVPVARRDAVAGRLGRFALVEQQQPLQMVQLLVVERVVRLGHVDLPPRLGDVRHVVGHPGGVLHVLGVHEVAVRPVGRVEVPPHALDPDRTVGDRSGDVLAREHQRHGAVADGRDVEALDGPGQHLAREDVVDGEVGLAEQRGRMIGRVPLVLHRDLGDVALLQPVRVHVPVHLEGEDPQEVGLERAFDDVVEDRDERALRVRAARRHLLLGDAEHHVGHPGGDRVPPLDRREDPGPAPHVGAHERLAPRAGAVGEVVALAVDAVERVGRGPQAHRVHAVEPDPRALEGGRGGDPRELLAGLLGATDEPRHARADDRDPLTHAASPRPLPTSSAGRATPARAPSRRPRRAGAPRTPARVPGRSPRGGHLRPAPHRSR